MNYVLKLVGKFERCKTTGADIVTFVNVIDEGFKNHPNFMLLGTFRIWGHTSYIIHHLFTSNNYNVEVCLFRLR